MTLLAKKLNQLGLSQKEIAEKVKVSQPYVSAVLKGKVLKYTATKKFADAFGFNIIELVTDFENLGDVENDNQNKVAQLKKVELDTETDELPDDISQVNEDDVIYNSFNNKFERLPNGEYLMYMPLFEWDVAASLLDHNGDTRHPDYEDVAQHVAVVKEPLKGKYSAFRIKGGSMEGTEVNRYIPDGSIVWGRELQMLHWKDPLRISRFPLWVIGSTDFGRPTLKEIVSHDVENATIVVDSWNPSIEYAHNVPISLNTVKMLYYVFKVETPVADVL